MKQSCMSSDASVPDDVAWPAEVPYLSTVCSDITVHSVSQTDSKYVIEATSSADKSTVLREVYRTYHSAGYDIDCTRTTEFLVFTIEPLDSSPSRLLPVLFFLATIVSTVYAGASWYHVNPYSVDVFVTFPFVLSVLGVLGIHEFGHYLASRYHNVRSTLPYFLPIPTLIGTMGAVIRIRGRIPDRKALFDIGVSGPLFGLLAACLVAVFGLYLPPVHAPEFLLESGETVTLSLGYPPLLQFFAWLTGQPLVYEGSDMVNPVVIGAWVGLLITFLNLLPVGQLDGGHVLRAMVGEKQETVGTAVPIALLALSVWVYQYTHGQMNAVLLWVVWASMSFLFMANGSSTPVYEDPIGRTRLFVGVVTFSVGVLCFTPVPVQIG